MPKRSHPTIVPIPSALTWRQRVAHYHAKTGFPESLFVGGDGRVTGTWIMGNNYTTKKKFYGEYPHGYLNRVRALFPEKACTLHLFAGEVDTETFPGVRVDINPERNPDILDNAETMEHVDLSQFDLVLADPPYSHEDCEHYGTCMVNRNKVMRQLQSRLSPGCHVVWLDQVLPMYRKADIQTEGHIGMVKSTNHRFRVITIFGKR